MVGEQEVMSRLHWFYSCYDEYYEFTLDEYKGSKHWEYYYDWLNDMSRIREEKLNQILGISKNNPTIGDLLKSIILK